MHVGASRASGTSYFSTQGHESPNTAGLYEVNGGGEKSTRGLAEF